MFRFLLAALVIAAVPAGQGMADDLTAEEMVQKLLAQKVKLRGVAVVDDGDPTAAEHSAKSDSEGGAIVATSPTIETVPLSEPVPKPVSLTREVAAQQREIAGIDSGLTQADALNIPILFGYDSAYILPESRGSLRALCQTLSDDRLGADSFVIIGHTDASGDEAYNLRLSRLRAEEVSRRLVEECGLDAGRLNTIGLGEGWLLEGFGPRDGEQRRVEVSIRKSI